jgi:hypothetical protein
MSKPGGTLRNLMIWTHERGTLQYDIICALILAFIFLVPRSCFVSKRTDNPTEQSLRTVQPVQIDSASAKSSRISNIP